MSDKESFRAHVHELERLACAGDQMAAKSLACMVMILHWNGLLPPDGPNPGDEAERGDTVIDFAEWAMRKAA